MKKLFFILLGISVIFSSFSQAEVKKFSAKTSYVIEKNETLEKAQDEAFKKALSEISMQAAAAIRSRSVSENNQLTEDILKMATASLIKIEQKNFDMQMTSDNKPEIIATVTASVDIDEAKKKSAELMLKTDNTSPKKIFAEKSTALANWWENDMLTAEGSGFAPDNSKNIEQAKYFSRQAAMLDGYRKLAEKAAGIHITASKNIVSGEVEAVISGAEVVSEKYDEKGNCTIVLQVPIYGVNSIAQSVFKPVSKKDFPAPSTENNSVAGNYTGLIIDCGDLELNPVLLPTIENSDAQKIYGYENLDYEKVVERGMIGYMQKSEKKLTALNFIFLNTAYAAEYNSRAGNNPLVIPATALSENNSCPIVSSSDADKILAENQASHFLDNGSVVFLSNGRILGGRF